MFPPDPLTPSPHPHPLTLAETSNSQLILLPVWDVVRESSCPEISLTVTPSHDFWNDKTKNTHQSQPLTQKNKGQKTTSVATYIVTPPSPRSSFPLFPSILTSRQNMQVPPLTTNIQKRKHIPTVNTHSNILKTCGLNKVIFMIHGSHLGTDTPTAPACTILV